MSDETCERHGCLVCEACAAESTAREILAGLLSGATLEPCPECAPGGDHACDAPLWRVMETIDGEPHAATGETPAEAVVAALRAYVEDARREAGAEALGSAADVMEETVRSCMRGARAWPGGWADAAAWLRARAADARKGTR